MSKDFFITDHRIFDPLHKFIRFDELEKEIINSFPFQRLHDLKQLGATYFVYPGATNTRFAHSLGVMHIATTIYETICKFIRPDIFHFVPRKGSAEYFYWKKVIRVAALCHDLGHLPFSHVAEKDLLGEKGHEELTQKIIYSDFLMPIFEKMMNKEGYLPHGIKRNFVEDVCRASLGPDSFSESSSWEKIMSQIITADFFGADRIDYLLRDSLSTGVMHGSFDFHQLIEMLRILPCEDGQFCLGIDAKGVESCEALLLARYFMYRRIYQHPAVMSYHFHLRRFMKGYFEEFDFNNVDKYLKTSDSNILLSMKNAAFDEEHPLQSEARRVLFKGKRFKAIPIPIEVDLSEFKKSCDFPSDHVFFEESEAFLSENDLSFPVAKELFSIKPVEAFSEILNSIPATSRNWVFAHQDVYEKVIQKVQAMVKGSSVSKN
jgi:HD superfamily phosphohydrolase